jgi:hypothetical protein
MMQTKYIIQMKMPGRPDLDYYYVGPSKSDRPGPLFDYRRPRAKRYSYIEEAYRDLHTMSIFIHDETLTVTPIKCRT